MQVLQPNTDPVYHEMPMGIFDRFLMRFLNDKRDLPFVYVTLQITLTIIPIAILLYLPFIPVLLWWILAGTYVFLNNFTFKGPFGLMLHCTSHRKFFKKRYSFLNHYLPWIIGPFFGQTPETYYSHHIFMHHPENNLEPDQSTTMPYQRNSFKDFLRYFFDFLFLGMVKLISYFKRNNRQELIIKCLMGELLFIGLCVGLSFISLPATLVVFIIPFLISRFIMMLGNWTQHAFIAPEDPGNPYKNSITCVNNSYNHKCWNDGYHTSHHIRQGMHWTQHPEHFIKNLEEYAKNKSIVFQGIGILEIFWFLMRGKYQTLANHAVNINNGFSSNEEFIQHLLDRCKRID